MGTYDLGEITKKLYESKIVFFSGKTLKDILAIRGESSFFNLLNRLIRSGVLQKIERNKYSLKDNEANDFALANFLYQPSYISFESALNFYGILSQFPREVTSATSKKTKTKAIQGKAFSFTHLNKALIWGYEKKDDFLIAFPEKALLDQLYLAGKGLKKINLDELDYNFINKRKLSVYLQDYPETRQFLSIIKKLRKYIKK